MIINCQKDYTLNMNALKDYVQRLRPLLQLRRREFNICFVGNSEIARLNNVFRRKRGPTDVLSFPWHGNSGHGFSEREFRGFMGDVVISIEAARENALREGHSTLNEIRWLVLHGLLHLLGYDHETDQGEMTQLEVSLRERLGLAGSQAQHKVKGRPGLPRG
jgi:probable rRNA maturation factor